MNLNSIESLLNSVDDFFYTYLLAALLILVGLYLTARTHLVQLRHFGTMVNSLSGSRSGAQGGISSFQAFAVGLAARVGIGNIAGVALAVVAGGPGALFWMWIVALIGMATSFVESTLAQIFKERGRDFTFRGGPAYYIKNGLGSALWGKIFAAICIVSVGVTVVMVQTNSLAQVITATVPSVSGWMVGVFLVLLGASLKELLASTRPSSAPQEESSRRCSTACAVGCSPTRPGWEPSPMPPAPRPLLTPYARDSSSPSASSSTRSSCARPPACSFC